MDLHKLETTSLKRYRRVFQLPEVDAAAPKAQLVTAVQRHFTTQVTSPHHWHKQLALELPNHTGRPWCTQEQPYATSTAQTCSHQQQKEASTAAVRTAASTPEPAWHDCRQQHRCTIVTVSTAAACFSCITLSVWVLTVCLDDRCLVRVCVSGGTRGAGAV